MHCPYCGSKTEVTNSRYKPSNNQVWRRRGCIDCAAVFTTHEAISLPSSIMVNYKNSSYVFDPDKLYVSIYDSLRHRKDPYQDARGLYDTITKYIIESLQNASIDRDQIVAITVSTLRRFDQAASTQYAAFHPTNQ